MVKTVRNQTEYEIVINKSRFICLLVLFMKKRENMRLETNRCSEE